MIWLDHLRSLERDGVALRNSHRATTVRVSSTAHLALADLEHAETPELNATAIHERASDAVNRSVHYGSRFRLRDTELPGDGVDELAP
jgi:hypothetical protein